jgi:hypothetical protein
MTPEKRLTEQEKKAYNQAVINDNKIISEQPEHGIYSSKVLWQKPFYCSEKGCQLRTHITRRINVSVVAKLLKREVDDYYEPLCEEHFQRSHASEVVEMSQVK